MVEKNEAVNRPLNEIFDRKLVLGKFWVLVYSSFSHHYRSQSRRSRRSAAAACKILRVRVVEKTMATRSGGFVREGRRWKWGKADVEGSVREVGRRVIGVLGEEGAAGRVATMAGCMTSAIVSSRVRS